ncbi:MAG: hypothetical protein ACTII7_08745 [Galactobacter sp.]
MNTEHKQFLSDMHDTFTQVQQEMTEAVESLSKTMATWLTEYSTNVRTQTNDRLDEWNQQTREFAGAMVENARALGDLVDEMDRREANGSGPTTTLR